MPAVDLTPKVDDGGPAFAKPASPANGTDYDQAGMSLRDYFAASALQCYLGSRTAMKELFTQVAEKHGPGEDCRKTIAALLAKRSYLTADAMLAERQKPLT